MVRQTCICCALLATLLSYIPALAHAAALVEAEKKQEKAKKETPTTSGTSSKEGPNEGGGSSGTAGATRRRLQPSKAVESSSRMAQRAGSVSPLPKFWRTR